MNHEICHCYVLDAKDLQGPIRIIWKFLHEHMQIVILVLQTNVVK